MKTAKISVLIIILLVCLTNGISFLYPQQQEKIIEKVDVVNIEVPVRVLMKNRPVEGLKKEDFKLFVNGKIQDITSLVEIKKRMEYPRESRSAPSVPRLFLLVFNISTFQIDMDKSIDNLFDAVLREGDRIIVFTNHFFLNDREIKNLSREKEKIENLLKLETRMMKRSYIHIEDQMNYLGRYFGQITERPYGADELEEEELVTVTGSTESSTVDRLHSPFNTQLHHDLRIFFESYFSYVEDFKDTQFYLNTSQYVKLAEYLNRQQLDKWVLNFYQLTVFPQLKFNGPLFRAIERSFWRLSGGGDQNQQQRAHEVEMIMQEAQFRLQESNKIPIEDIGSLFINSGATVHTLLMRKFDVRDMENFAWKPIWADSEMALRQMSRKSGGEVFESLNIKRFFEDLSQKTDVFYKLTYAPTEVLSKADKPKIKVLTGNPDHRLLYDDLHRPDFVENLLKAEKDIRSRLNVDMVHFNDNTLSFQISGIYLNPIPENKTGNVKVRIQWINNGGATIFDKSKTSKTLISDMELRILMPKMKRGTYNVIVEVTDMNTGMNDLFLKEVNIHGDPLPWQNNR